MATHPNLTTIDLDEASVSGAPTDPSAIADGLIAALDGSKTSATFFVPGAVAGARPELLRRLSEAGHEVGCLTMTEPSRERPYSSRFSDELQATKAAIESATGARVRGHRNATFALDFESEWAYDVLIDQGFEYDSSRFPLKYAGVGRQPVPRGVHVVRRWGGTLLEIPVSTADVLAMRVQIGTAGSVRGLPMPIWSAVMESHQIGSTSLVMHLRASELRHRSPFRRATAGAPDHKTLQRLSGIVGRFNFTSVARALPELVRSAPILES
jgi:hypothetical protein